MILIGDKSEIYCTGLSNIIHDAFEMDVVFDPSSNVPDILANISSDTFKVVIIGSFVAEEYFYDFIPEIKKINRNIQVLLMPEFIQPRVVKKLFSEFLIDGILMRDCRKEDLVEALDKMLQGEIYIDKEVRLHSSKSEGVTAAKGNDPFYLIKKLSDRELEVMEDIVKGISSRKIAEKLFLSEETVKTHRKNLLKKLGVNNTFEVIAYLDSIKYGHN